MKLDNASASESNRASTREWLPSSLTETSDRLYWMFAADLLFAARPSQRGRFVYEAINPAFESLLGISSEEIREMDISACLSREDAGSVCEGLRACVAERAEVRIRHRLAIGGPRRTFETSVAPVGDVASGGLVRLIGSHRILKEGSVRDAVEGIADARKNARLISIQEDIQQRIASELHDSTCQHLIAASLSLMRIRSSLGDPGGGRLCDDIDASIDEALREIRAFTYLLHPRDLNINGLKATIERYAEGFATRTSLRVRASIASEVDRLPYEKQRSLLRIVQEALTNVFRHAKASEVTIVLDATGGCIRLTVSDDGRGMPDDPSRLRRGTTSPGVGIAAMRARLQQIGGTLDIRSGTGARRSGTVLCAAFPHDVATSRSNRRKVTTVVKAFTGTR